MRNPGGCPAAGVDRERKLSTPVLHEALLTVWPGAGRGTVCTWRPGELSCMRWVHKLDRSTQIVDGMQSIDSGLVGSSINAIDAVISQLIQTVIAACRHRHLFLEVEASGLFLDVKCVD